MKNINADCKGVIAMMEAKEGYAWRIEVDIILQKACGSKLLSGYKPNILK